MITLSLIKPWAARFWSKVQKSDGCWLWTGSVANHGYGQLTLRGHRPFLAHRLSWELAHGPIPKGDGHHGAVVMHTCDNRICVNPAHLVIGTQRENMADMAVKGRASHAAKAVGVHNGNAKLTPSLVQKIRAESGTCKEIARDFGVSVGAVAKVRRRATWRHVA